MLHEALVLGKRLDFGFDQRLANFSARDRGLVRALVSAVLRNLPGLDGLIDSATKQPLPYDARARQVLRVALAGHYVLDTPDHAVVATALPLVEGRPRRLVHGVLSNLLKQGQPLPPTRLPGRFQRRWTAVWGADEAKAAAVSLSAIPPTDLRLRDVGSTEEWAERLGGRSLMPGHVRLDGSQQIVDLPGFREGAWWVQDIAAQLPATLLGDGTGARVLDLCAAPGGKTMQLAAGGADVVALDISEQRMGRLKDNLGRTGLSAELLVADVLEHDFVDRFDMILLDAPCSATGTYRRNPEVFYLKEKQEKEPLVQLQRQLLERAAGWLRPDGRLVYAVCSLEEEERAPDVSGLVADPITAGEAPEWAMIRDHHVATPPSTLLLDGGADGFQMARFRQG